MLVVLMGHYHHIVQSQPLLQPTYIDIDPNQSNFHEDRTIKLRMISSYVKMVSSLGLNFPHLLTSSCAICA